MPPTKVRATLASDKGTETATLLCTYIEERPASIVCGARFAGRPNKVRHGREGRGFDDP